MKALKIVDYSFARFAVGLLAAVWAVLVIGCAHSSPPDPLSGYSQEHRLKIEDAMRIYANPELPKLLEISSKQQDYIDRFTERLPENIGEMTHNPALDFMAELSAWYGAATDDSMTDAQEYWYGSHYGLLLENAVFKFNWFSGKSLSSRADDRLEEKLSSIKTKAYPRSFGVARINYQMSKYGIGYIINNHKLELNPFPKHIRAGEKLTISGQLQTDRYTELFIYYPHSSGQIEKQKLEWDSNKRFHFETILPQKTGTYQFTIRGTIPESEVKGNIEGMIGRSILLFPVYVGVQEPKQPPAEVMQPAPNPKHLAHMRKILFDKLNAIRQYKKLPTFTENPELNRLAKDAVLTLADKERPRTSVSVIETAVKKSIPEAQTVKIQSNRFRSLASLTWMMDREPSLHYIMQDLGLSHIGLGLAYSGCTYKLIMLFASRTNESDSDESPRME